MRSRFLARGSFPLALVLLASRAVAAQAPPAPCDHGYIEQRFNHLGGPLPTLYKAMHMSLIPKGAYRGHVLVWDAGPLRADNCTSDDKNIWSIINPELPIPGPGYLSATLNHPIDSGDLGCSGHAWMKDGRLFVCGGNTVHGCGMLVGSQLAYIFDPEGAFPGGMWIRQPDLARKLWYPAVVMIAETNPILFPKNRVQILGGDINDDDPRGPPPVFAQANTVPGVQSEHPLPPASVRYEPALRPHLPRPAGDHSR